MSGPSIGFPDATRLPLRWRLAGLLHRVPEFRGRDRLKGMLLRNARPPGGTHRGTFGPGLRFEARYQEDTSLLDFFFLQYEPPALAGILEEALGPGSTFFDVGANVGVYAAWAAKIVGDSGSVHAFEPVPSTRESLSQFIELNSLGNVHVVPCAVGAAPGSLTLHVVSGSSGLASAFEQPMQQTPGQLTVPVTSLDAYIRETSCVSPELVKIDVEGYEFEVLRGARDLVRGSSPPAVVFESMSEHLLRTGGSFEEISRWFDQTAGYRLFGLLPEGLRPLPFPAAAPVSPNTLAVQPAKHRALVDRLSEHRFRRNQNL